MVVSTYNVRTMAAKGKGGYGHDECVLAKGNLAVTAFACRNLGEPTVQYSIRRGIKFVV